MPLCSEKFPLRLSVFAFKKASSVAAKADGEAVASVIEAVTDGPSVEVADGLDDGEPQSVALLLHVAAAETAEQRGGIERPAVFRHVAHRETVVFEDYVHRAAGRRVAYGVDDEVLQQTLQQYGVCTDGSVAAATPTVVYVQRRVLAQHAVERQRLGKHRARIHFLRGGILCVVYLGQYEQVAVQVAHAHGQSVHVGHELHLPLGQVLLHQHVELAAYDGDGCLKLVRGVLGKLLLYAEHLAVFAHQAVKRAVEAFELADVRGQEARQTVLRDVEPLRLVQRVVEGKPQAAGDEAHGDEQREAHDDEDEQKLKHHAGHDVALKVERRYALAALHGLDDVYHIFGIEPLGEHIEQRRRQHEDGDGAQRELRQRLRQQALHLHGSSLH